MIEHIMRRWIAPALAALLLVGALGAVASIFPSPTGFLLGCFYGSVFLYIKETYFD